MNSDVKTLLAATKGKLIAGTPEMKFEGVTIDSRTLEAGQLFICIKGENFDGHDFLEDVIKAKAAGVIVSDADKLPDASLLERMKAFVVAVPDTLTALQELAAYHRNLYNLRVIGVTGTNGKSTTKEMIASVVNKKHPSLKTEGNLNNHIGLPLTLLNLARNHQAAVLEMGMSASGEIARLAEIANPRIGVITNISQAHMTQLKTVRDIQQAKGELFKALPKMGIAIANADDPLVMELTERESFKVITFGIDNKADVMATDIRPGAIFGYEFNLQVKDKSVPIVMPLMGRFNIYNALAAAAVGVALDIPLELIKVGLKDKHLLPQRGESTRYKNMTLINDSYNANPESMRGALETLKEYQVSGKKYLVIGDMLELGDEAEAAHRQLGAEIAQHKFDCLVTVGELASLAGKSAAQSGMGDDRVKCFDNHQAATDFLKGVAEAGDCLLFKGSRGAHMETVLEGILKQE